MCYADGREHGRRREAAPQRHSNENFLSGAQAAAAVLLTHTDRKDAYLLELRPGVRRLLGGPMDACQRQQLGQGCLDRVRQSMLVGRWVILDAKLHDVTLIGWVP